MEFIYYPRCGTCLKALKKLKEQEIDVTLRDIVNETPTQEELLCWIRQNGKGIKPFFNTSGKLYREMNLKDKINDMNEDEAALLLSQNGMLIKRPLLIDGEKIIIGYQKEIYEK